MLIKDKIYGNFQIDSPILIDLIKSKPLQRLKGISQMGPPDKYYHLKGYSRYEHSVGVMLLLKYLGASIEEQIAGLLHDISHTAFSHVIDWVIGSGHIENFQDNQHIDYFLKTEVKNILKKYGYNPVKIANNKNYSLLERDLPKLCADRIEYSIREFPLLIAKKCFAGFTVFNNRIIFKNRKTAYLFAVNFLKRQKIHWGGYEAVTRYCLFAKVLKFALNNKLIKFSDFMKDENYIVTRIETISDIKIKEILSLLKKKNLTHLPKAKTISHKKFRYVDPEFIIDNKLIRLSIVDREFKQMIEEARKENKKGIKVGMICFFSP